MERLMSDGLQVLIPPDANKRKGERPGWQGGLYAFMRRVLAGQRGGELYARRQVMVEPVFANTKFNRRCDRFLRRGRSACRSEWRLINATHNLLKSSRVLWCTGMRMGVELLRRSGVGACRRAPCSGTGALGERGRAGLCVPMGCEPAGVTGRPCDLPGCAASADP